MANNTSPHILGTSANLLGFCLFVITSLHISNLGETHLLDKLTSLVGVMLSFSCIFSFISIKTKNPKKEVLYESIAEYLFLTALGGILVTIIIIAINFLD